MADLTIDGNKANNSTGGYGLRLYGYNFVLRDLRVRNCRVDGIYSEWGSSGSVSATDQMEAYLVNVKSHDNGQDGIDWNGPHDSTWTNVHTFLNGRYGTNVTGNGLGLQATNIHSWGTSQTNAFRLDARGVMLVNCQAEGSTGPQILIRQNDCQVHSANVYNGFTTTNIGIQIGDVGMPVGGTILEAYVHACVDGALKFVNDSGQNHIRANVIANSGTAVSGTVSAGTKLQVTVDGLPDQSREIIPITNNNGLTLGGSGGPNVMTSYNSPEGAKAAPVGSLYLRRDGGSGTTLYVKTSGTGNTGWSAIA